MRQQYEAIRSVTRQQKRLVLRSPRDVESFDYILKPVKRSV